MTVCGNLSVNGLPPQYGYFRYNLILKNMTIPSFLKYFAAVFKWHQENKLKFIYQQ
jgi:hypothetical protein